MKALLEYIIKNLVSKPDEVKIEEIEDFFAEALTQAEHVSVAVHIADCADCRDLCAFAAKAEAEWQMNKLKPVSGRTKEKIRTILNLRGSGAAAEKWQAFNRVMTHTFTIWENADVLAAGDLCHVITFSAAAGTAVKSQWKMKLFLPEEPKEFLDITVETASGQQPDGTMVLCGNKLNVQKGKTSILYDDLKKSCSFSSFFQEMLYFT